MSFVFRCFSTDTWKSWDKSGHKEVSDLVKKCLKEQDPCLSKRNRIKDLNHALYEVVWAVVMGELPQDKAKTLLYDAMANHGDVVSAVVEVVALVELELSGGDKARRDTLVAFMQALGLEKMYKERLELDTLEEIGVVRNKKMFHTRQIKVRTKMFYKQQKFNLLREECEGYAKLVTELNQTFDGSVTPQSMIQVIRNLIGCFNLDPNRVLDLILESMEVRAEEHHFYTSLLHLFPCQPQTLTELLGFRMKSATDLTDKKGVLRCMALLVQAGVLGLEEVYAWLSPADSLMHKEYLDMEEASKELVRKANVISTKDKDKDKEKIEEKEDEMREREFYDENRYNNNLKVHFCIALLEIGDWENYAKISARFSEYYIASIPIVNSAIAALCHSTIEPHYRSVCELPARAGGRVIPPLSNPYAVSRCLTLADVTERLLPMACALGPYIARHPSLMVKLLRVARVALDSQEGKVQVDKEFYYEFFNVLDEALLPGLSMLVCNPCMAEEIWDTIKLYPYAHRFKLYGNWKNNTMNEHASLVRIKTTLLKKAKYVMMRVTKDTVKPVSRTLAKLTHNCPANVLDYIVKQIQLYDNLIVPIVDSLKYLTYLSLDVLSFSIVEILSASKERLINAGMAVSPWLNSLSNFCGAVYKKYPMELCGILQFIANQLKAEKSVDLLILQEILQKMGGTETAEGLTAEQVEALTGGEILRREAGTYLQERNIKRSSQRLKEALLNNKLAIPLLLLIAQQRSCIVYNETESPHLKLVGKLYDQCQETLAQYGSYLFQVLSLEEISERLASIGSLLSESHINSDIAFFLYRPSVTAQLTARYEELCQRSKDADDKQLYIEACDAVLPPIVEEIRPHFPAKLWEEMHPSFFLTFWSLTLADLEVPTASYKREMAKMADQVTQLQKPVKNEDAATTAKKRKEVERLTQLKDKLLEEEKAQNAHTARIFARLDREKDNWFTQRQACLPKNDTVTAFLQLCLFPRATFTTHDALFCARFVKMMHQLRTPNFSTLIFCDRMFCDITYTVASCTEQEAVRYAQFLQGTLEMVMHWHASAENYEKECAKFPGFVTRFRVSKQESNDYVDYENYRHVVHKWHFKMTKALVTCLESKDYIQIRNAILVLQGIHSSFPAIVNLANVVDKRIEKVKKEERNVRNDLYVLANSYSGRLRSKKSALLQEKDFHQVRRPDDKRNGVKAEDEVKKEDKQNGALEKTEGEDAKKKDGKRGKPDDTEDGADGKAEEDDRKSKKAKTEEKSGGATITA